MSSNLYWRPTTPEGKHFGYSLKFALREHWGQPYIGEWVTVDANLVPVLRGIIVGAGKDSDLAKEAQVLIDLIEKHGEIDIKELN